MKLVSVNVGLPRLLTWGGATFKTGIFKNAVEGRVMLRTTNLDGDRQADLSVHGGPNKAVYCYPREHYPAWNADLPDPARTWGAFGENFTTEDFLEADVSIGEGEVGAGDEFELLGREKPTLAIAEVNRLYTAQSPDRETLQRSLHVKLLPESWRMRFRARLADMDGRKHDGHTSPV